VIDYDRGLKVIGGRKKTKDREALYKRYLKRSRKVEGEGLQMLRDGSGNEGVKSGAGLVLEKLRSGGAGERKKKTMRGDRPGETNQLVSQRKGEVSGLKKTHKRRKKTQHGRGGIFRGSVLTRKKFTVGKRS